MNRGLPAPVTFLPAGITVEANSGDTILDAGLDHGIHIEHECGGNCSCTTCHVIVEDGEGRLTEMEEPESFMIQHAESRRDRSRLACQALLTGGPVTIRIPPRPDSG